MNKLLNAVMPTLIVFATLLAVATLGVHAFRAFSPRPARPVQEIELSGEGSRAFIMTSHQGSALTLWSMRSDGYANLQLDKNGEPSISMGSPKTREVVKLTFDDLKRLKRMSESLSGKSGKLGHLDEVK